MSHLRGDSGVSPVLGALLILAISVLGIAGVLYWGAPAVDSMRATTEFRAVAGQFSELDSDLRELVAGSAGKSVKKFEPSISRGSFTVEEGVEKWAFGVDFRSTRSTPALYNFTLLRWSDGDYNFTLANRAPSSITGTVRAYLLDGAGETLLNVTTNPGTKDSIQKITWGPNQSKTFYLVKRNAQTNYRVNLTRNVVRIEVWNESVRATTWWVADMGRVHYRLSAGGVDRDYYYSSGALIQCTNRFCFVDNVPPLTPLQKAGNSLKFFARTVSISGGASFGGEGHFTLVLTLYGSSTLLSSTEVRALKYSITGSLSQAWKDYIERPSSPLKWTKVTDSGESYYLKVHPEFDFRNPSTTCGRISSSKCLSVDLLHSFVGAQAG